MAAIDKAGTHSAHRHMFLRKFLGGILSLARSIHILYRQHVNHASFVRPPPLSPLSQQPTAPTQPPLTLSKENTARMPSGQGSKSHRPRLLMLLRLIHRPAGTNPIHNKKPKKKQVESDDEDKAFKAKQQAGVPSLHLTGNG